MPFNHFHLNDTVPVYVIQPGTVTRHPLLSLRRGIIARQWQMIENHYQHGDFLKARVVAFNKGGLLVDIYDIQGFVPISHIVGIERRNSASEREGRGTAAKLRSLKGKELHLKILEIDRHRDRLILSERLALQETLQHRIDLLEQHKSRQEYTPIKLFLCYAREDELLMQGLEKQLSALRQQHLLDIWYDREISTGADWEREIEKHLDAAQLILLLISPDFIASDYCYSIELRRAMERHERGEVQVIPVILRPVYWQETPFGKLQALPTDARAITSHWWHSLDEALFDVAEGIRTLAEKRLLNEI